MSKLLTRNMKKAYIESLIKFGLPVDSKYYWWVRYPKKALKDILDMKKYTNAALTVVGNSITWTENIVSNTGKPLLIVITIGSDLTPQVTVKTTTLHGDTSGSYTVYSGHTPEVVPFSLNQDSTVLTHRNIILAWCSLNIN